MKKIKIVVSRWNDELQANKLELKDAEGYPVPKCITPFDFTVIKGKYFKDDLKGWYVIDDDTGLYVVKDKTKAGAIDKLGNTLEIYEKHLNTITYENQKKLFQELLNKGGDKVE